jgi:probable DNA repair protein
MPDSAATEPVDASAITLTELLGLAPSDTLVLTVNNRLARTLKTQIAQQLESGATELPDVSPWTAWLTNQVIERLYQDGHDSVSQVLDSQTVRLLWGQAIAQCEGERSLIDVDQIAAIAADADALLLNWAIEVPAAWHTPDFERFVQWRAVYEENLARLDAIDVPRVSAPVSQWIASGSLPVPQHVVLMGFTDHSAAMRQVLGAMVSAGSHVHVLDWHAAKPASVMGQMVCATPDQEWAGALDWAKRKLASNPQGRFAIVVPDLQAQANRVRCLLARELAHEGYNISVAPSLAHWPLAKAMLSWLALITELAERGQVQPAVAGQALLAGGCAGADSEAGARATIEARWRHRQWLVMSASTFTDEIAQLAQLAPAWDAAWQEFKASSDAAASWYDWANTFRRVLAALGFPGQGTQTSVQYQVTMALDQLMSALAMLDDGLAPPHAREACHMLGRLAHQTLFQPQRDARARLDVLGLLEAEGGHWDGVWVTGVTDDVLPAVANPNPLIPVQALARAGAPRSTAKREHDWAVELMQALRRAGHEVVFSWPAQDGEQPKRPSPLLADIEMQTVPQSLAEDTLFDTVELESWSDEPVIEVSADEKIRGGVAVLQTQAANPMWAFFQYRLGARGLPAYAQWPGAQDRGNLLHKVLELLWLRWGNQARLLQAIENPAWPEQLSTLVAQVAERELAQWPAALRALEIARTLDVVNQWLAVEANRAPFAVVECEAKHEFVQGPLHLSVTIDRIDELPDGQRIVFDYKSGASLPRPDKDWQSMSFRNPQLLVYARVLQDQGRAPEALAWIQLHASSVAIQGISAEDTAVPGIQTWSDQKWSTLSWSEQMAQWQSRVKKLAHDFAQGKHDNVTWRRDDLKYCTIGALLRLHAEADDE